MKALEVAVRPRIQISRFFMGVKVFAGFLYNTIL
jgi:hypothetical protein